MTRSQRLAQLRDQNAVMRHLIDAWADKIIEEVRQEVERALEIQREKWLAWARTYEDRYPGLTRRVGLPVREVAKLVSPPPARRRKKSVR